MNAVYIKSNQLLIKTHELWWQLDEKSFCRPMLFHSTPPPHCYKRWKCSVHTGMTFVTFNAACHWQAWHAGGRSVVFHEVRFVLVTWAYRKKKKNSRFSHSVFEPHSLTIKSTCLNQKFFTTQIKDIIG